MTLHKKLFFVLALLLPVNLAKHFIYPGAYVDGILVDYLIPTLYLTDLLIAAIAALWLFEKRKVPAGTVKLFVPFALFAGISVVFSARLVPSLFVYMQMLAHIFIAVYAAAEIDAEKDFYTLAKITGVLAILLGALVLAQWAKQGAVFNNYAFFGEQPYSAATLGIAKQALFDKAYVLPYATFRHPNALGGFLSVALVWLMYGMAKRRGFALAVVFGALALFLAFSPVAWAAFVFGILALFLIEKFGKGGVLVLLAATATVVFLGIGLLFLNADGNQSVAMRAALMRAAAARVWDAPFVGSGPGTAAALEAPLRLPGVIRFPQPVHNIFVLVLLESGIFALVSFIALWTYAGHTLLKNHFGVPAFLFVSLLQLAILGSFDHYLVTMQQTQLLFWLTLGLALSYTKTQ